MILINAIQCPCSQAEVLVSSDVHDYAQCSCGKYAADGGNHYLKRSFPKYPDYIELSIIKENGKTIRVPDNSNDNNNV